MITSFQQLPNEIITKIALNLDPLDLWNFQLTCKAIHRTRYDEYFKKLYIEKLGFISEDYVTTSYDFFKNKNISEIVFNAKAVTPIHFSWMKKLIGNIQKLYKESLYPNITNDLSPLELNTFLENIYRSNLIPYIAPINENSKKLKILSNNDKEKLQNIFPVLGDTRALLSRAIDNADATNFYLSYFLDESISKMYLLYLFPIKDKTRYESYLNLQLLLDVKIKSKLLSANDLHYLGRAITNGYDNVVEQLIEAGADPNKSNRPLFMAAENGHLNILKKLIEAGADLNKADKIKRTPLFIASQKGHLDIVKELIKAKADLNTPDIHKRTPLYIASQMGHLDIVKELIKAKAEPNKPDKIKRTPLFIASKKGCIEVVEFLINENVGVNITDQYGQSPLYIASQEGNKCIVEMLMESGANINQARDDGVSPLKTAICNGNGEVAKLLMHKKMNLKITSISSWWRGDG
ncbi:MAG: ankyrin repeat domain-containing protein [Chlamydiota bacterium]|nr:ankyrin repeat domain-containing protein [Chlamydiota bacterium]